MKEPYFVPIKENIYTFDKLSNEFKEQLSPYSILYRCMRDMEFILPKEYGFIAGVSATQNNSFAIPYFSQHKKIYNGPFEYKKDFEYDFLFIGNKSPRLRTVFFELYKKHMSQDKSYIHLYDGYMNKKMEEKNKINKENNYESYMMKSKFIFCPIGCGLGTIRFSEILNCNSIPIYIAPKDSKLPLDWLINWDEICLRIYPDEIDNLKFIEKINHWNSIPIEEINIKRKIIHNIYHQYINNESELKEQIMKKVKELI